jgi:translin
VHRQEKEEAERLLTQSRALLGETAQTLAQYSDLLHGGFVHNAQKEFAEGSITLALVSGIPLPDAKALGVDYAAYLNGLGEAVGELRRYLLDSMRRGDLSRGEEILTMMDDIYGVLVTMDFPDALTAGLRRTTDMVRGVLEKTRGDLTLALEQRRLGKELETLYKGNKAEREV